MKLVVPVLASSVAILMVASCGGAPTRATTPDFIEPARPDESSVLGPHSGPVAPADSDATPAAREVLAMARSMLDAGTVVRGSCWGYVNAVFDRAGFPHRGPHRETVFHGGKRGPYAPAELIEPGDWLYFINHSYGDVPHSAIFVAWQDEAAKWALTITYAGGRRHEPGRLDTYELRSVFRIVRARPIPDVDEPL